MNASPAHLVRAISRTRRGLPTASERRRIRIEARVPQQAIADALGITRQAVSGWESGQTPRDHHVFEQYVAILEALKAEIGDAPGRP